MADDQGEFVGPFATIIGMRARKQMERELTEAKDHSLYLYYPILCPCSDYQLL